MSFIGQQPSFFYDAGYSITGTFYIQTGAVGTSPIPSNDIYTYRASVGVYMLNKGFEDSALTIYPIYGSSSNLAYVGANNDVDNAYLVYPGYGFILYPDTNYTESSSGTTSRCYYNTSNAPVVFYNVTGSSWTTTGSTVIKNNNGNDYGTDKTSSIQVFYRGTQLTTPLSTPYP